MLCCSTEIAKFIQDLRAAHNGSLSGMVLQDIVDQVSECIKSYQRGQAYQVWLTHCNLGMSLLGQRFPCPGSMLCLVVQESCLVTFVLHLFSGNVHTNDHCRYRVEIFFYTGLLRWLKVEVY